MLRFSLAGALLAAALALPQAAASATTGGVFEASLTIIDACTIDSYGNEPQVACRNSTAWRVDGNTVTF